MKGISHFIIEVKNPFKDTIEVGAVKLFVDKKISRDRASNRFGKIISLPVFGKETILKEGYEIIFDATILYQQIYKEGVQESIHLVNKEKSWYKIESDLIILYRKNESAAWKGYKDNLMVSFIKEESKVFSGILTGPAKEKLVKGKAIVKYNNDFLEEQGVINGQEIFINPSCGIPFFFKKETVYWIRSKDVLAV
jgi:co-chaperonin GroES (HSP10)